MAHSKAQRRRDVMCSDSTVALACGLLVAHLYLHDYPFVDRMTDTLTGSVSLTAATFASVLVASRLKTQIEVFSQVTAFRLHCVRDVP